jgi:hypothetical protein
MTNQSDKMGDVLPELLPNTVKANGLQAGIWRPLPDVQENESAPDSIES